MIYKTTMKTDGYASTIVHGHPRASASNHVLEHILVVELAMGKELRRDAEIHHVNGNRGDNQNSNLVVCDSHSYHGLLHARQRALDACGHASWRRCSYCATYDDIARLVPHSTLQHLGTFCHKACRSVYQAEAYLRRKGEKAS